MKMTHKKITTTTLAVAMAGLAVSAGSVNAAATIYEPFAYTPGVIDGSQAGGTGLSGTGWAGTTSNVRYSVLSGGLSFTGVVDSGGKLQRASAPGAAEISRGITGSAQTALTADDSTIWFSVLMQNNRYSSGNAQGALVFGSDALTSGNEKPVAGSGEGFGVMFRGYSPTTSGTIDIAGIAIDGGVSSVSTGFIDDTGSGGDTYFIVGRIDWTGGTDTMNLFNVSDVNAALPTAFATMTADLDQSAFDTLAIGGAQIGAFDESRYGLTAADVGHIGVPEPSTTALLGLGGLALILRRRK